MFVTPVRAADDVINAEAESIKLSSPNFTLRANISPKLARALLQDMENLRTALRDRHKVSFTAPDIHLDILIVEELEDFLAFAPGESSAAFYSRSALGPKIIVNASDTLWDPSALWEIMYHEYAHHFHATYLGYKAPLWLDEGMANYAASFNQTGPNTFEFGYVDRETYDFLSENLDDWLPSDKFIAELKKYPIIDGYYGEHAQKRQALYYAQSWLIAYWMHHTEQGEKAHIELINRVDKGEDIRAAFPADIHEVLQNYIRNFDPKLKSFESETLDLFQVVSFEETVLSEYEMAAHLYLQVSQDGGGETFFATMSKLRNILEEDPNYAAYKSAIRSIKLRQFRRYVAARQLMNDAARERQDDPGLQRLNAIFNIALIPNFSEFPSFDAQDLRTHKAHIETAVKRAIKTRSGDVALDIERLHALGRYSQNLSKDQKLSLDRILSSDHHKRNPILSLSLVYPLIAQKKFDEAEGIVTRARLWSEPEDQKDIADMTEDIRLNRLYAQP
ncbi:MAG: hypothetical protein ABJN69_02495 [Hellea sp.]